MRTQEFECKVAAYTQPNLDFAAPERVLHDGRGNVPVDAPSDMWSFGVCPSPGPGPALRGVVPFSLLPPDTALVTGCHAGILAYALWNNGRALYDNKHSLLDYKHHLGQVAANQLAQAPAPLRHAPCPMPHVYTCA
jgi:hypothetical protein